jgi:hypothetical protein
VPPKIGQFNMYATFTVSVPGAGQPKFSVVATALTVMLTDAVAVCAEGVPLSVTWIVALNVPAEVGVPPMATVLPDKLSASPGGNAPALNAAV